MIAAAMAAAFVPLLPDGEEAREWAERELADPVYRAAEPTFIDRAARAIAEFFAGLFSPSAPTGWGAWAIAVVAVIAVAAVVAAILIWGRPRLAPRADDRIAALFDADDERSAEALRRDATEAAGRERWEEAIVLRFRAFARGLVERGIVEPPPGATARAFAREAAATLPALDPSPDDAAITFDDVRYLRRPGTPDRYAAIALLDEAAARARPPVVETRR